MSVRTVAVTQLRDLIGARGAIRLVAALGGEALHLAKRADDLRYQQTGATLGRVIGPDAAEALRHEFAGESVRVPRDGSDSTVRIEELLKAGRSVAEICRIAVYLVHPTPAEVRRVARDAGISIGGRRAA